MMPERAPRPTTYLVSFKHDLSSAGVNSSTYRYLALNLLVLINNCMRTNKRSNQDNHSNTRLKAFYDAANFIAAGDKLAPEEKLHLFVSAHFRKCNQDDLHHWSKHFRNCIDRVFLRRSGRRLYKALWIEEGKQLTTSTLNTAHAHWLIEVPEHISQKAFKRVFCALWIKICRHSDIEFKVIEVERGGVHGLVSYCLKESEMGNTGVFIEDCSDNARLQKNRKSRHIQQR